MTRRSGRRPPDWEERKWKSSGHSADRLDGAEHRPLPDLLMYLLQVAEGSELSAKHEVDHQLQLLVATPRRNRHDAGSKPRVDRANHHMPSRVPVLISRARSPTG
jgi:hypothetical protein